MAKTLVINSNCQPDQGTITIPKNVKLKIDNQSGKTCTITFTNPPGPFSHNPIIVDPGKSKEEVANNQGSWNYTTQCGTTAKAARATGGGGGIIIVDPPMPAEHRHAKDDHQENT